MCPKPGANCPGCFFYLFPSSVPHEGRDYVSHHWKMSIQYRSWLLGSGQWTFVNWRKVDNEIQMGQGTCESMGSGAWQTCKYQCPLSKSLVHQEFGIQVSSLDGDVCGTWARPEAKWRNSFMETKVSFPPMSPLLLSVSSTQIQASQVQVQWQLLNSAPPHRAPPPKKKKHTHNIQVYLEPQECDLIWKYGPCR